MGLPAAHPGRRLNCLAEPLGGIEGSRPKAGQILRHGWSPRQVPMPAVPMNYPQSHINVHGIAALYCAITPRTQPIGGRTDR